MAKSARALSRAVALNEGLSFSFVWAIFSGLPRGLGEPGRVWTLTKYDEAADRRYARKGGC